MIDFDLDFVKATETFRYLIGLINEKKYIKRLEMIRVLGDLTRQTMEELMNEIHKGLAEKGTNITKEELIDEFMYGFMKGYYGH
jgi:hypothetical protein